MSDAESAAQRTARALTELKVSGRLMTLEPGLYCIVHNPSRAAETASGLPGVRLSLPPGALGRPEAVSICSFRDDGWLQGAGDAALVRVVGGSAQVLVTVYQSPNADAATAPNLQVVRLLESGGRQAGPVPGAMPSQVAPQEVDLLAHVQTQGDVGARLGSWVGDRGSKRWIEGFAIAPASGVPADDIEYQAVLGRGWTSPWVEGGQFCGSRGMALPILGLRVRLRGATAATHECLYAATFVDGSSIGPVMGGEACEAESLAPVEAFSVTIRPRAARKAPVLPAAPPPAPARPRGRPPKVVAKKPALSPSAPARPRGRPAKVVADKPVPAPSARARPRGRPPKAAAEEPAPPPASKTPRKHKTPRWARPKRSKSLIVPRRRGR
jgi:hypothetical protein